MPILSIIIPTFNSANTFTVCLESIVCQTFQNFDVWIIDGVSTDNTLQIVKEYAEKYPNIYWISEPDKGIYDAMNKGIELATGEWLYFLGSDDRLFNGKVLEKISENFRSNLVAIYGQVLAIPGDSIVGKRYRFFDVYSVNPCHQAIFYNKILFNIQKYDLEFKICADWNFNLMVFSKYFNKIKYIPFIIAVYNLEGTSMRWWETEEYKLHFKNTKKLIMEYLNYFYWLVFRLNNLKLKIIKFFR